MGGHRGHGGNPPHRANPPGGRVEPARGNGQEITVVQLTLKSPSYNQKITVVQSEAQTMILMHAGYHPTTAKVYNRLLPAPIAWVQSSEGRGILAKCLRHVRNHVSRNEAADLRDALYIAWCVGKLAKV